MLKNFELDLSKLIFSPVTSKRLKTFGFPIVDYFNIFILTGKHENAAQGVPGGDTNMACVPYCERL